MAKLHTVPDPNVPAGICFCAASVHNWFILKRGRSGTGCRIAAAASVPVPLEIRKQGGVIHVLMNKVNGVVEIVALESRLANPPTPLRWKPG